MAEGFGLCVLVATPILLTCLVFGVFTPISFFGKVEDTDGNPVPGAQIQASFGVGFDTSTQENTTSDGQGNFWLWGHGASVMIMTSKSGYYSTEQKSDGVFDYSLVALASQKNQWHASPFSRAIFTLRKMGVCEPLIEIKGEVKIARDGTPLQMNLSTGRTYKVTDGDIQVEAWTHDRDDPHNVGHTYDWRCEITVLGGGLQPRTGEFDFIAPEEGYQTSDEINMAASNSNWRDWANREYFLKLADGSYARISFTMCAGGDHFFDITSYHNPVPGRHNLEFDPAKQIKTQ